MRIRHLVSYLSTHPCRRTSSVDELRNAVIAIDAIYWLRSLQELKDPYSAALGGTPLALLATIDKQLEYFDSLQTTPIFVFEGIQNRTHGLFVLSFPDVMEEGWADYAAGKNKEAHRKFLTATSRITTDWIYVTFHYLKQKNIQCIQGPYFSCSQISYLIQHNYADIAFGPPALFLYDLKRVILGITWLKGHFHWVDFMDLIRYWGLTSRSQFLDACLLTGTEICLTHPYLELKHSEEYRMLQQQQQVPPSSSPAPPEVSPSTPLSRASNPPARKAVSFSFSTSIECVKIFPLAELFQFHENAFLTKYKNGYASCRAVVQSPLFIRLDKADPTSKEFHYDMVDTKNELHGFLPSNFNALVGQKLSNALYLLIVEGIISRKLPSVFALGEWLDNSFPAVTSLEYYEIITEMENYRLRAIGLIAQRFPKSLQNEKIFFQPLPSSIGNSNPSNLRKSMDCSYGRCWTFTSSDVREEMRRQGRTRIDWKFVFVWFANCKQNGIQLWSDEEEAMKTGPDMSVHDGQSIIALVYFMLLEILGLIADNGELSVFGTALAEIPSKYQNDCLILLEMMKFGLLMGEPLAALPQSKFPENIKLVKHSEPSEKGLEEILLASRIMSFYPVNLKKPMWDLDVDFDLAGYHSVVKVLTRSLRHLTEACIANILLKDISKMEQLPSNLYNLEDPLIPCFFPRHNCMGIIAKFFLEYPYSVDVKCFNNNELNAMQLQHGSRVTHFTSEFRKLEVFDKSLRYQFRYCSDPLSDLCGALAFLEQHYKLIQFLCKKGVSVGSLKDTMDGAMQLLKQQCLNISLNTHPEFPAKFLELGN